MIAFEISLDGRRISTIGIGQHGKMTVTVSASTGYPPDLTFINMGFGGLDIPTDESVSWPWPPEIGVGSTISIRIVEADTVDEPRERKTLSR